MENLYVKNVSVIYPSKTAGERVHALDNINLTISSGDFVVALGASGQDHADDWKSGHEQFLMRRQPC